MKLNIPKGWDEVYVDDFLELRKLETDNFKINFSKQLAILSVITGEDEEVFEDLDVDELNKILKSIAWIKSQPSTEFQRKINNLHFKGFENLTLGEYIDIEHFISEDYYENLPIICAILYRQKRTDDWGNIIWEPYDNIDIWKRSEQFLDIPITDIFGIIQSLLNWRNEFMDIYQGLFQPEIPDADPDEELSEEDLIEEEKEQRLAKFAWAIIIDKLSNNDITKVNTITNLPLVQVMNHLTMKKVIE